MPPIASNTVAPTITPAGGYNQYGAQFAALMNSMNTAPAMPQVQPVSTAVPTYDNQAPMQPDTPQQAQAVNQGVPQIQGAINQMQNNYPQFGQQVTQSLNQQSGYNNLANAQGNLGQIFDLYLHDQNLASKYAAPTQNAGVPNMDTYLAPSSQIIAGVTPPPGSSFPGFTNPNAVTAAMGAVPSATSSIVNALGQAMGWEQSNIVSPAMSTAAEEYQANMNTLGNLLGILSQHQTEQYNLAQTQKSQALSDSKQAASDKKAKDAAYKSWSAEGDKLVAQLKSGQIGWGDAWPQLESIAAQLGLDITPQEIDQKLGKSQGWDKPGAYQNYVQSGSALKSAGTAQGKTGGAGGGDPSFATGVVDQMYSSWKKMNPIEKGIAGVAPGIADKLPAVAPDYANMQSLFYGDLLEGIRKAGVGGRITQFEIKWMHDYLLPGPGDSPQTAQNKINALKQSLTKKIQDPNYTIGSGSDSGGSTGGGTSGGSSNDPLGLGL